jgi:ADP-heptose:LPS heptosyltransferase
MKRKLITFSQHKSIFIVFLEKYKTKILPSPLPAPIANLFIRIFGKREPLKNFDFSSVSSILIRPGAGVGDAVVLTSSLYQLKLAYKNLKIGVLINARDGATFKNNPHIDQIIEDNIFSYIRHRKKWQVFLDTLPYFNERNIVCDALLAPKCILALRKHENDYYMERGFRNYDFYCPQNTGVHFSQILKITPFAIFVDTDKVRYFVQPDEKPVRRFDAKWERGKIRVMLNSTGQTRVLDKNSFMFFISKIKEKFSNQADFIILNNRRNKRLSNSGIRFSDDLNLEEFIAFTSTADIIITPDTSLVHLACAFGIRLISFYPNTDDMPQWLPLKDPRYKAIIAEKGEIKDVAVDADLALNYLSQFISELSDLRV